MVGREMVGREGNWSILSLLVGRDDGSPRCVKRAMLPYFLYTSLSALIDAARNICG